MADAEGLPPRGGLTNPEIYTRTEDAIRSGLQTVLGDAYQPRASFAQFWEGVRGIKGMKPEGGVIDWLSRHGLLDPGAMGDPAHIESVLGALRARRQGAITALANATARPPRAHTAQAREELTALAKALSGATP